MAEENNNGQFSSRSLAHPSQVQAQSLGWAKNRRERQIDTERSLATRYMKSIDRLNMESAKTLDRMASVASFAYADATGRMQAIADSQPHPAVQQRVEAFNTQTIDPILQRALGATFLAGAERVHSAITSQSVPPPEEKKPSWWDRLLDSD